MPGVWFIRHGESEANAGLPTLRPTEIGLTAQGMMQAEQIACVLREEPSLVITSRYWRTLQTAQPTLRRFPTVRHELWNVEEFTYLTTCEKTYTTTQERKPLVDAFWQRGDPLYKDGTGTESFVSFIERVQGVLKRLQGCKEPFIIVFSHEQFMRAIIWLLQSRPSCISSSAMKQFRDLLTASTLPNGAILPLKLSIGETPRLGEVVTNHLYMNMNTCDTR